MNATDKVCALAFLRNLAKLMELHGVKEIGACSCCDGIGISGDAFVLSNVRIDEVTISADEFLCEPRDPGPGWRELAGICTRNDLRLAADSTRISVQCWARSLISVRVDTIGTFDAACHYVATVLEGKGIG